MDKTKKIEKKEKKAKIFCKSNFIEKEAEESEENENKSKSLKKMESNLLKDTQYSSEVYSYEDSYGISSDNETEKIEKQMITNRNILNKEKIEKIEIVKIKRKRNQKGKKNKDKKRYLNHIKKDMNKIKQAFGIVNGKLNIGFDENKESNEIKINSENNITPEKKIKCEDDEDVKLLKMSNERKTIAEVNKNKNNDFIKRIKDNETFIKNNIINNEIDSKLKKNNSCIILKNKERKGIHPKLKLYNMKGAFLNKKKK